MSIKIQVKQEIQMIHDKMLQIQQRLESQTNNIFNQSPKMEQNLTLDQCSGIIKQLIDYAKLSGSQPYYE